MVSTPSRSLAARLAGSVDAAYTGLDDTPTPSSIDWKLSITVPTRTVILPSLSTTPTALPDATSKSSSSKPYSLSPHSIILATIVTSVIICIVFAVFLYHWRAKNQKKAPKSKNIGKPAVTQMGLSTWSLDSQIGLDRAPSGEKRVEWIDNGKASRSLNIPEAMSARGLIRRIEEASCGIRTSSSNGITMSRSDTDSSVSSTGKAVKPIQDTSYGAIAVKFIPPGLDQRGMDNVVGETLTASLGYPEQVLAHGDRVEAIDTPSEDVE